MARLRIDSKPGQFGPAGFTEHRFEKFLLGHPEAIDQKIELAPSLRGAAEPMARWAHPDELKAFGASAADHTESKLIIAL